ncbi:glutathione S-transferase [Novosphingobium kunmingense]|uniref:glutathione transferase n=1 Tax=Novosphingobium kunmingense TaxID=1211806 RepID=A0A2N0I1L0_9SPHN|nr:glutathione S-transferase [Novosphingobium kunmingense]PKB25060.1 glutathione S-transferase [Novosphingobium kunmingense]
MLTVHHLRISQSERIVWLCEELGLDYDLRLYNRREDNRMAPDDYKALHPMGIAPVIEDEDLVLGESGAICEYIARKYGGNRLSPGPDDADFAGHLFWFHFSNATFMTNGMMALAAQSAGATELPAFVADRGAKGWQLAEARLAESPFFGGRNLTLADIMMGFNLTTSRAFGGASLATFPNIAAYLQRIGERPAYQTAMAKAEPGMAPMLA